MRETWIVAQRELKSYFTSPIAYVFGALFLIAQGFFSSRAIGHGMPATTDVFFTVLSVAFIVFLPALTMRLWSEERKLGTLELLMTFPVRISELIAGKFCAAMIYLLILLALTIGLPWTLDLYGAVDWGQVGAAYAGSVLTAAAYVAMGMFWSSLTRDQIVAMLLSVVSLGALFCLGIPWFLQLLARSGFPDWSLGLLSAVSPFKYFQSMWRGVIDTRDIVYFLSFCALFLYANAVVLRVRRVKG